MLRFLASRLLSSLLLSSAISLPALALPLKSNLLSIEMPLSFTANYDFEGIVALSNCSGSLIQLENVSDSAFGLILTNGHCFEGGMLNPNTFVYNQPSRRAFTLLDSKANNIGRVTATAVIYATMTGTDMAIYQLKETYAEIKSQFGIRPLTLASQRPIESDAMEVLSGFWRRGYSCVIETFVNQLREDKWTMVDSIRYSRPGCETIGGTSGSPIIKTGTRTVIGVNNTGNESGRQCTMNNPCEVDTGGNIVFVKGYSYGQQTYWVYSCLNSNNEIDLSIPGCLLYH